MKHLQQFFQTALRFKLFDKEYKPYVLTLPVVLTIVYAMYIFIPFGASDDYDRTWRYILSPETSGISLLTYNFLDGRLFTGFLLWLFFKPGSISYLGMRVRRVN